MRKQNVDRLLAGTMLAMIAAAPTASWANPERVQSVRPPPPVLNNQMPRREAAPVPPPASQRTAPEPRVQAPAPASEPVMQAPVVQAPAVTPREPGTSAADIKSTLDKQLAASDAPITDKLREIVPKQLDRRIERGPERKAMEVFYASRGYAPLWIRDGQLTAQAKSAIVRLKDAAADGLDATDYAVPELPR